MTDRKKPSMAFWATMVLVAVVAYLLSTGPAIWLDSRSLLPAWAQEFVRAFYYPIELLGEDSDAVLNLYMWYTDYWRSSEPKFR